jgi:hypothetical protein
VRIADISSHCALTLQTSLDENNRVLISDLTEIPMSKICTLSEAVRDLVNDGDIVAMEGFTHLIPFAAGHEIIRQRKRDLTLIRMTPDVIYDQLIGAGCARKLIFS